MPRFDLSEERAEAAASSSAETQAWAPLRPREGRCMPSMPAASESDGEEHPEPRVAEAGIRDQGADRQAHRRLGEPHHSPAVDRVCQGSSTKAVTSSGTSSVRLSNPTMRDEWLIRYAW